MGRASRQKKARRDAGGTGTTLRAAVSAVASTLDAEVAGLKTLLMRLPFLQVIANISVAAAVGYRKEGPPFPMPLALEYVTWLYLSSEATFDIDGAPIGGDATRLDEPDQLRTSAHLPRCAPAVYEVAEPDRWHQTQRRSAVRGCACSRRTL